MHWIRFKWVLRFFHMTGITPTPLFMLFYSPSSNFHLANLPNWTLSILLQMQLPLSATAINFDFEKLQKTSDPQSPVVLFKRIVFNLWLPITISPDPPKRGFRITKHTHTHTPLNVRPYLKRVRNGSHQFVH